MFGTGYMTSRQSIDFDNCGLMWAGTVEDTDCFRLCINIDQFAVDTETTGLPVHQFLHCRHVMPVPLPFQIFQPEFRQIHFQ